MMRYVSLMSLFGVPSDPLSGALSDPLFGAPSEPPTSTTLHYTTATTTTTTTTALHPTRRGAHFGHKFELTWDINF